MTVASCLLCGGSSDGENFAAREMMVGLREQFTYRRCAECGSLWLADPPDDLARFYGTSYYSMESAVPLESRRLHQLIFAGLARLPAPAVDWLAGRMELRPGFAQSFAGQGVTVADSVLDVGCGEGDNLRRMARCGFTDLTGVDPFIAADRVDGPIRLRKTTLGGLQGSFNRIIFNHSLEHMPDPRRELEYARERLEKGGSVIVRLPVLSEAWRHYGTDWVALDPPRHLFIPSLSALPKLAEEVGFKLERTFFDSTAMQFWASERYRQDVPLRTETANLPAALRSEEAARMSEYVRRARELNRRGAGDNAGFVFSLA